MEERRDTITEERGRIEAITREEERAITPVITGGSMVEAVAGAAAVVLAILGLLDLLAASMAAVATIAVGMALFIGGGTLAARFARLLSVSEARHAPPGTSESIVGGMAMGTLFGAGGMALGILALLETVPMTLIPVAVIVFGTGLLMASGATARLNELMVRGGAEPQRAYRLAREAVAAASGSEVLVGLGGVVLGILALADFVPLTLSLVALLGFGVSILLSGTAIASRMLGVFYR